MWPFNKAKGGQPPIGNETRSSGTGYTSQIMAARESWFSGQSGLADLTGTVQSCVSLWEGALTASDVIGTDMLDRRTMALAGRSLALRGEFVGLITGDGIVAASDWDISTRNGIPRAYRGMPAARQPPRAARAGGPR